MTQEDKELLLKDLSARISYNVICQVEFKGRGKYESESMFLSGIFKDEAHFTSERGSVYSDEYKPYLFPISSMTKDQKLEWYGIRWSKLPWEEIEWLHKGHWDYRGLIEKGLALDATELNIY